MVRILNLGAIKNTILYLSRKRIELSLIIFIPVFLPFLPLALPILCRILSLPV